MTFDKTFDEWLAEYLIWREARRKSLSIPLTETASLARQWDFIGTWRMEAGEHAALAEYYYRKARWKFREDNPTLPQSSVMELSKNSCSKEQWAYNDSTNFRDDLANRYFILRDELKKGIHEAN